MEQKRLHLADLGTQPVRTPSAQRVVTVYLFDAFAVMRYLEVPHIYRKLDQVVAQEILDLTSIQLESHLLPKYEESGQFLDQRIYRFLSVWVVV